MLQKVHEMTKVVSTVCWASTSIRFPFQIHLHKHSEERSGAWMRSGADPGNVSLPKSLLKTRAPQDMTMSICNEESKMRLPLHDYTGPGLERDIIPHRIQFEPNHRNS